MEKILLFICFFLAIGSVSAQKFISRSGQITFFSSTPIEDIEAVNNETAVVFDFESAKVIFQVPIKSFKFEKALMQTHFNENYMESNEYPKAEFRGAIRNFKHLDFKKDGSYEVITDGILTIHGVSLERSIAGNFERKGDEIFLSSKFLIKPGDHEIKIPALVEENIAEEIEVSVKAKLEKR